MIHLRSARLSSPRRRVSGFTLIELMITVAIIGILAAIALPAYSNYVIRAKLLAMTNTLAGMRTAMEQFYQDNRTYYTVTSGSTTLTSPCTDTANYIKTTYASSTYSITCAYNTTVTPVGYTLTATGTSGAIAGAAYTVTEKNVMATTGFPTKWGSLPSYASSCWLMRKGDSC